MTPRTAVTRVKEVRAAARKLPERVALHEQALARLRTLIVRDDLAPGVAILETKLSEELGISRTAPFARHSSYWRQKGCSR